MSESAVRDEQIQLLVRAVAELKSAANSGAKATLGTRSRRRSRVIILGGMLLAASVAFLAVDGVAGAQPGGTSPVSFVAISPAYKLLSSTSIAANKTDSVVVVGGSTTVPTNATAVQLSVTAGGTASGFLTLYPAGNLTGGSGQSLSWAAKGTDTETVQESIGTKDELTFANNSAAAAKVTATITGYSTQVTDTDVSGLDGSTGQVLTDNGSTAVWQTPSVINAAIATGAQGKALQMGQSLTVVQTNLPIGDYWAVTVDATFLSSASATGSAGVGCELEGANGADIAIGDTTLNGPGSGQTLTVQGIVHSEFGNAIELVCSTPSPNVSVAGPSLVATQIGTASGNGVATI